MFFKSFSNHAAASSTVTNPHKLAKVTFLAKVMLLAMTSLALASCILGSSDRSSNDSDNTDDHSDSALETPVDRESTEDILTTTSALHSFKLGALADNPEVVNDDIEFLITSYPTPEETDDVDNNRDDENVITVVTESWTDILQSWDAGTAPGGTITPYVTLTSSGGWSGINRESDQPDLYMIDGEIREDVLGVTYEWVVLKEKEIPKITLSDGREVKLEIAGIKLPTYPTWLAYLFRQIPDYANFDNPVDSIRWMSGTGFDDDADLFGDTVDDLEFDQEAMLYVVSRYVVNTVYTIEQVGGQSNRSWPTHDLGLTELQNLAAMFNPKGPTPTAPAITDVTDLEYGLYKDGDIYMGFYFLFDPAATLMDCLVEPNGQTKAIGQFFLAYENKDGRGLQARSLLPQTITQECVGENSVFILALTAEQKIDAGLGGNYDLFLSEASTIDTGGDTTFFYGKRYNKTVDDPVINATIPPLLLYNDTAIGDIKNAIQVWRDRDYLEAL